MTRPVGSAGLRLQHQSDRTAAIDALADLTDGRVGAGVLDDLNRRGSRAWAPGRAVDRAWTFDAADRRDLRWWPQGVSVRGAVVALTWYAKQLPGDHGSQGVRITFFDLASCRYRHVLLVRPTLTDGAPGIEPLTVHAGGLVWSGDHLHVAATGKGFHTARLSDLTRLRDDDPLRTDAFDYRYVLPVSSSYRASVDDGGERLRYSFLSSDGDDLVVGEYAAGEASRRLARIALQPDGLPATDASGYAVPEVLGEGPGHMQGAVRVDERWYVTTSHGRSRLGSVWTGAPGDFSRRRWATPMGPEDLTYVPETETLWTVTEHPWARWICAMGRAALD
ncbi:hypothetical protein [Nocardioides sp.]|uniref:hypothetical protein n=1 Tax=Nocardioides sp. TaxID=35761 RepID=UPI00260E4D3A|nr:hypothetical protein [Nocardioides sp.]